MLIRHKHEVEVNINFGKLQIELINSAENEELKAEITELKSVINDQSAKLDQSTNSLDEAVKNNTPS